MGWTFPDNQINVSARITYGAAWNDVDLSADVPAGTKLAILHVRNTGASAYKSFTRPNGSANDISSWAMGLDTSDHGYWLAILDGNRVFEGYFANVALDVAVIGYTDTGTYFDPPYDKKPTITTDYEDRDCSAEIPGSNTAALLSIVLPASEEWALRPNGSTFDEFRTCMAPGGLGVAGLDANRIIEAKYSYLSDAALSLWGYTNDIVMLDTPVNVTPGATITWTDCDASLPEGAVGAVVQLWAAAYPGLPAPCTVRKKGSSDNIVANVTIYTGRQIVGMVGLDASQLFQGYIKSTNHRIYVIGYVAEPAANPKALFFPRQF